MEFSKIVSRELGAWADLRHPRATCSKLNLHLVPGPWMKILDLYLVTTQGRPYFRVRGPHTVHAQYMIEVFTAEYDKDRVPCFSPEGELIVDFDPTAGPQTWLQVYRRFAHHLNQKPEFIGVYHDTVSAREAIVNFYLTLIGWKTRQRLIDLGGLFATEVEEAFWVLGRPALYKDGADRIQYADDLPYPPSLK